MPFPNIRISVLVVSLALALFGCPKPRPDDKYDGVRWCSSIGGLLKEQQVQCLEFAGSAALGTFGPPEAPKRFSVQDCFGKGAEGLELLGVRIDKIGEYSTNYVSRRTLEGSAGADLKQLTGLTWAPDFKLSAGGTALVNSNVKLMDASWRSISNVGQHIQSRIDQLRYSTNPSEVKTLSECQKLQKVLCSKGNVQFFFPEEVLEARPVITLSSGQALSINATVGFDHAGVKVEAESIDAGTVQISWTQPIVLGSRSNSVSGIMSFDCP